MLTAQVPGTAVVVGMSRRLFAACQNLDEVDHEDWEVVRAERPDLITPFEEEADGLDALDDEEIYEQALERRAVFAERDTASRQRQILAARDGFERGQSSTWPELLSGHARREPRGGS